MCPPTSYFFMVILVSAALSNGLVSMARAAELDGAWTNHRDNCAKVFTKQADKLALSANADFYGSGFVIDGKIIRGKSATCKIKSMTKNGSKISISAVCATDVMLSDTKFVLALGADGRLTRSFAGMPEMTMDYFRCSF